MIRAVPLPGGFLGTVPARPQPRTQRPVPRCHWHWVGLRLRASEPPASRKPSHGRRVVELRPRPWTRRARATCTTGNNLRTTVRSSSCHGNRHRDSLGLWPEAAVEVVIAECETVRPGRAPPAGRPGAAVTRVRVAGGSPAARADSSQLHESTSHVNPSLVTRRPGMRRPGRPVMSTSGTLGHCYIALFLAIY